MANWSNSDLTGDIIDSFCTVYHTLKHRRAYSQFNLAEALTVDLRKRGHQVAREVTTTRSYRGEDIGRDRVDLVVDERVAVVVKNVAAISGVHYTQLRAYLDDGKWPVGLLCNFGEKQPVFRRVDRES